MLYISHICCLANKIQKAWNTLFSLKKQSHNDNILSFRNIQLIHSHHIIHVKF